MRNSAALRAIEKASPARGREETKGRDDPVLGKRLREQRKEEAKQGDKGRYNAGNGAASKAPAKENKASHESGL